MHTKICRANKWLQCVCNYNLSVLYECS